MGILPLSTTLPRLHSVCWMPTWLQSRCGQDAALEELKCIPQVGIVPRYWRQEHEKLGRGRIQQELLKLILLVSVPALSPSGWERCWGGQSSCCPCLPESRATHLFSCLNLTALCHKKIYDIVYGRERLGLPLERAEEGFHRTRLLYLGNRCLSMLLVNQLDLQDQSYPGTTLRVLTWLVVIFVAFLINLYTIISVFSSFI